MSHDERGNSYYLKSLPEKKRRKIVDDNMHLIKGMEFRDGFPVIKPYNGLVDLIPVAYSEKSTHPKDNAVLHFFVDDFRFRDAVWFNLEYTTVSIAPFNYVFTPDLTLWRNLPTEYYNYKNIYRTRFVGAYWQMCGFNVIPTASWGGLESFSYCFNGLPEGSVIAVSAMGVKRDAECLKLWCYGVKRLIEEKNPSFLLIYGEEFEMPNISVPFKFLTAFVTKRFRNGNKRK